MASNYEPIEYDVGEVRELFDSCIFVGTITKVKHDVNKANVETEEWGTISDIPIHYHCPGKETVDDGHLAFEEGDEVYLLHDGSQLPPNPSTLKVVGRVEGLKVCPQDYVLVRFQNDDTGTPDKCFVWDVNAIGVAINIPKNGGGFALFPCDFGDITQWYSQTGGVDNPLYIRSVCGAANNLLTSCTGDPACPPYTLPECSNSIEVLSDCRDHNGSILINTASINISIECSEPDENHVKEDLTLVRTSLATVKKAPANFCSGHVGWCGAGSFKHRSQNMDVNFYSCSRTEQNWTLNMTRSSCVHKTGYQDWFCPLIANVVTLCELVAILPDGAHLPAINLQETEYRWGYGFTPTEYNKNWDELKVNFAERGFCYSENTISQIYIHEYVPTHKEISEWGGSVEETVGSRQTQVWGSVAGMDNTHNIDARTLPRTSGFESAISSLYSAYIGQLVPNDDESANFSLKHEILRPI